MDYSHFIFVSCLRVTRSNRTASKTMWWSIVINCVSTNHVDVEACVVATSSIGFCDFIYFCAGGTMLSSSSFEFFFLKELLCVLCSLLVLAYSVLCAPWLGPACLKSNPAIAFVERSLANSRSERVPIASVCWRDQGDFFSVNLPQTPVNFCTLLFSGSLLRFALTRTPVLAWFTLCSPWLRPSRLMINPANALGKRSSANLGSERVPILLVCWRDIAVSQQCKYILFTGAPLCFVLTPSVAYSFLCAPRLGAVCLQSKSAVLLV